LSSATRAAAIIAIIIVVVFFAVWITLFPAPIISFTLFGTHHITIGSENPQIGSQISYPSDYSTLANYTLSLINSERQSFGLSSVSLSQIQSAQQHADSMLYYGYFSHWDTQGYKPYMRYTLLGGSGYVEENIAEETSSAQFISTPQVEDAIRFLENQMLYNDSACCQNGHRDNILNPYHNRVSIGIAYSLGRLYFVEDFETAYTSSFQTPLLENGIITLQGNTSEYLSPTQIGIFYDPLPKAISAYTLNQNYSRPYGQGQFIGGVLPPCIAFCEHFTSGATVYASSWFVGPSSIDISFSLAQFVQERGSGVYTLYLVQQPQGEPAEYLTSVSIFIT